MESPIGENCFQRVRGWEINGVEDGRKVPGYSDQVSNIAKDILNNVSISNDEFLKG